MIRFTWKRLLRQPLPALGVLIFAAILTVALCTLHQSNLEAQAHYEQITREIDVKCTLTNLTGTASDGLDISNAVLNDFTDYLPYLPGVLVQELENVQIKSTQKLYDHLSEYTLIGITSLEIAPELWPDNGCTIEWMEGHDESMFSGSEMVCIIPEELYKQLEAPEFKVSIPVDPYNSYYNVEPRDFEGNLTVAGVCRGVGEKRIYCPWNTLMDIWAYMGQLESAAALHATLKNNENLESFRALAGERYPAPDPNADYTSWELALDIDDSQLRQAELTLQNSLRVNELSRLLVFILTAAAGFLIGFLMIRSRKWEIALMRTLGTSNIRIFGGFALEQMICAALGAILGGASYYWQPVWQLGVFVGVYFVGLSLALVLFLRKNLLTEIKQAD